MRIVRETPSRLEIEHKGYLGAAICLIVFGFLGYVAVNEADGRAFHEAFFLTLLPIAYLLFVAQTSRVALDRDLGTVHFFRKSMFGKKRFNMPLADLFGARVEIGRGRYSVNQLFLVFEKAEETWQMPVSGFPNSLGQRRVKASINRWLGVSCEDVEAKYPALRPLRLF